MVAVSQSAVHHIGIGSVCRMNSSSPFLPEERVLVMCEQGICVKEDEESEEIRRSWEKCMRRKVEGKSHKDTNFLLLR